MSDRMCLFALLAHFPIRVLGSFLFSCLGNAFFNICFSAVWSSHSWASARFIFIAVQVWVICSQYLEALFRWLWLMLVEVLRPMFVILKIIYYLFPNLFKVFLCYFVFHNYIVILRVELYSFVRCEIHKDLESKKFYFKSIL